MAAHQYLQVNIHQSPWVSGTRAAAYFGPVMAELFTTRPMKEWDKFMQVGIRKLQRKVWLLKGTDSTGTEITVNPFYIHPERGEGIKILLVGTAAKLEPLF